MSDDTTNTAARRPEMKARFDPAKLSSENQLSYRLFEKRAARSEGSAISASGIAAWRSSDRTYPP